MSNKKSSNSKTTTKNASDSSVAETELFASGDLGHVQKFLFAEPLSRLSEDIERLSERLAACDRKTQLSLQEIAATQREQHQQLSSSLSALERHVEETDQGLQTRILEVEHAAENANDVLQATIQDTAQQWDRSLDQTREELFSKLVEASQQLHDQKLDRRAMAKLLSGLADTIETGEENLNISWLPAEPANG